MPIPSPISPRAAFTAIAISVASLALLQNLVIPVIPLIAADYGVGADAASWTNTAWLIAAAVSTPLLGRIGDLRGRRNTFLAVLAIVALGDIVASFAPNLPVLILGRVLQGVGGALFPLAFGLLRDVMPRERLTGAIGATSALLPLRLSHFGSSDVEIGVVFVIASLAETLVSVWVGRVFDRRGVVMPLTVALVGMGLLIAALPVPQGSVPLAVLTVGFRAALMAVWVGAVAMATDEADRIGAALALTSMLVNLAWSIGETVGAPAAGALSQATSDTVPLVLLGAVTLLTIVPVLLARSRPA
jgi:MFS family permease